MKAVLSPTVNDLQLESVLVQAWKKTASYIRSHNWYADTLELDYQSMRLPGFIREVRDSIRADHFSPTPLRFVGAPKSQKWRFRPPSTWDHEGALEERIRPLAHVDLRDQVIATAVMLCLANRVETRHGDVTTAPDGVSGRRATLTYGHRLFCDVDILGRHRHRWGSKKLYRQYYSDYRAFLRRPELFADSIVESALSAGEHVAIVQLDISRFYDRVRPELLHAKLLKLQETDEEQSFFEFCRRVFCWPWFDKARADKYARRNEIAGFDRIALPQGLVASGFFSNIVLSDFDMRLKGCIGHPLPQDPAMVLCDAAHYVDDYRLVLRVPPQKSEDAIQGEITAWFGDSLREFAPGLTIEPSKTKLIIRNREKRFLVQQSKTAERIQREISGAFDMLHGTELIGAIEGFFHTQRRFSPGKETNSQNAGLIVGISDMRDDTAERFAAGRFRRTFRSLRPMLDAVGLSGEPAELVEDDGDSDSAPDGRLGASLVLSREQLDERGKLFAATLIEEWVGDPANVRLLRIGLDIFPHPEFLENVLRLLRPGWQSHGARGPRREIFMYCLAELFRAGATETGMVSDEDALPAESDIEAYRTKLMAEAIAIYESYVSEGIQSKRHPWFLMQQVLLYILAYDPWRVSPAPKVSRGPLNRYYALLGYLHGRPVLALEDRSALLSIAVTAFGHGIVLGREAKGRVTGKFLENLTLMSPQLGARLWRMMEGEKPPDLREVGRRLGFEADERTREGRAPLPAVVRQRWNPFCIEDNLLQLALAVARRVTERPDEALTPWNVESRFVTWNPHEGEAPLISQDDLRFVRGRSVAEAFFAIPDWCAPEDAPRLRVGQLLRFALRGHLDYLMPTREDHPGTRRYRAPVSHWEISRYGSFNGRAAFGPDWLPISSWTESLLLKLLQWPGIGGTIRPITVADIIAEVENQIRLLERRRGASSGTLFLEQNADSQRGLRGNVAERRLRVCVVQTVTPCMKDYAKRLNDPELMKDRAFRTAQRRHLAAVIDAVEQMLRVRETHLVPHYGYRKSIDLIVFPELAVHPHDVDLFLLPLVRTHRCLVFAGLVYHPADNEPGAPPINSALWLIPEWSTFGLQVRRIEQGKLYLAAGEENFKPRPMPFRPAQWVVSYKWTSDKAERPLRITGSVCYDATDVKLMADLRTRTDLYLIAALNQDVGTFDRMIEALHYHAYQGVLVVNNGEFGGSGFYAPLSETHHRQILHVHGQPQASISFVEIAPSKLLSRPAGKDDHHPIGKWKGPPAGWREQPKKW
jgi:hypothetical protein